jgi:hypothetical protein
MDNMAAKIPAHNAIPPIASFIHFVFEEPREDFLLSLVFEGLLEGLLHQIVHLAQLLWVHVGSLYYDFGLGDTHSINV